MNSNNQNLKCSLKKLCLNSRIKGIELENQLQLKKRVTFDDCLNPEKENSNSKRSSQDINLAHNYDSLELSNASHRNSIQTFVLTNCDDTLRKTDQNWSINSNEYNSSSSQKILGSVGVFKKNGDFYFKDDRELQKIHEHFYLFYSNRIEFIKQRNERLETAKQAYMSKRESKLWYPHFVEGTK